MEVRIYRKILALECKTVANGCTVAEQISAQETIVKLRQKYGLFETEKPPADLPPPFDILEKADKARKAAKPHNPIFNEFYSFCWLYSYLIEEYPFYESSITFTNSPEKKKIVVGFENNIYLWRHIQQHGNTQIVLKTGQGFVPFKNYLWHYSQEQ